MKLLMFDIDGTLVDSTGIDSTCYIETANEVLDLTIDDNWSNYKFVTDQGILDELIVRAGFDKNIDAITDRFKQTFFDKISKAICKRSIIEIKGAKKFFGSLSNLSDVHIALATGGWRQSAIMKLQSAGFDVGSLVISSSDDHHSRVEIMKKAELTSGYFESNKCFYFGDGEWDEEAALELNYNFVGVGTRKSAYPTIADYSDQSEVKTIVSI